MKPFIFLCGNDESALNAARSRVAAYTDFCFTTWETGIGLIEGKTPLVPNNVDKLTDSSFVEQTGPFYAIDDNKEVFFGSDPLGLQPLYYRAVNGVLAVSNQTKLLFTALSISPELSDTALSGWLAGQPVPDLSVYSNITVLPAAHVLHCSAKNICHYPYWDIDPHNRLHFDHDRDYGAYFRSLLRDVVAEQIDDTSILGCQMSGGMDSTSVTALATALTKESNRRCYAISHYYLHDPGSDERQLINDMRRHLNLQDFHFQNVDDAQYRDFLALYPAHYDHPGIVLSPRYHDELADLQQLGITTLLTGNGGDEMCWGHASAYTQRLLAGETSVIAEVYKACRATNMSFAKVAKHLFIKPLVPQTLINLAKRLKGHNKGPIPLPEWLTPQGQSLAQASYDFHNPFDAKRQPMHHARYFALKTTTTFNSVRSYDAVASNYDIQVKHPFFHRRIAECSFALPPKQLIQGPYPKFILRNAMTGLLPDSVCWRKTKTTFDHHFANLVRENASSLRECLSHPYLADRGLLDTKKVLKAFDSAVSNQQGGIHVDLLFVILTQRWLQRFHV
ncbi:asparagine synthase-related protein [Alteromonas sp. C1M14]|uniref:asparagine synthase-related protein n=1 Tax=Alteromonas sp. C1M14 TaxID=2841567 RepID=UPI001C08B701|nr:hypothetical protein [Alteromonas sp. C1M14]